MTHLRQAATHCRIEDHGSAGQRMLTATRRAWNRYWTLRAARATAAILHGLDDRALKDIGLDRSEIESAAYNGRRRHGPCPPDRRIRAC